jgi:hypothetical protein
MVCFPADKALRTSLTPLLIMVSAVVHVLADDSDGGSRLFVQVVSIGPDYMSAQLMILVTDTWNGYSRRLNSHLSFGEIQTKIA